MCAGNQTAQWVFIADSSSSTEESWMLAVQLQGQAEAIDFLDNDLDTGSVITMRCKIYSTHSQCGLKPLHSKHTLMRLTAPHIEFFH